MVRNPVRVAIKGLPMSADEVITVTDLSLEPRDADCETMSWFILLKGYTHAAAQFSLYNTKAARLWRQPHLYLSYCDWLVF